MSTQSATKTLTLEYLKTIGIVNNAPVGRGFANPVDLAVNNDGRIYVLNRGAPVFARVGVCSMDEEYLYEFGSHGDGDGQFRLASGIALDSEGRVYVTDEYNHRVSIYDGDGNFLSKWGAHGSGNGELDGPAGIDIDSEGSVYISDQNNHRIQKFTWDGDYILQFGSFGSDDGQLNMPWGVDAAPDGHIYVADWRNDRVQKFTTDGQFVAKFGESGNGDGQFNRPSSVDVDSDGNIYVADWGNERVLALASDGSPLANLRGQATLSKWAMDFLAANPDEVKTREMSNLIPELPPHFDTPHLISSQIEPYFWGPASVNLASEGRMYVTESSRHRIQVYQKQ